VLDVPRQPRARVNGIQLCEWGSHDRDLGTCSWPPDVVSDIESQEGEHPLAAVARDHRGQFAPCDVAFRADDGPRTSAERRALAAVVRESAEVKARVSERLLASDQWDLFFTVFAESHCATHQFWDLHEPDDVADPSLATEVGDVVADTFARIDRSLEQLIRLAGAGATVVLVLHTGMAPDSGGNAILPEVVTRLAGPSLPFVACAFSNAVGAIRVRVEGRDRGGTVAPLAVPGVVAGLSDDLMGLVDDNTGTPAVRAIHTSAEAFPAFRDDTLPDLLVEWNGQDAIRSVSSRAVGTVTVVNAAPRTGNHTPDGLVVVAGPGIEAGSREPMDPASFSPMVAAMLDVR
jgi:predicted AlkP superfamily phosphohydrolase/phosphomutase